MDPARQRAVKEITYVGPSMNPTLKPGDRVEVLPYHEGKIRRGDVIVFHPPAGTCSIIHRIISVDWRRIRTHGDNNAEIDPWLLDRRHIIGRVLYRQRGGKRLRVLGGRAGHLYARAIRASHAIDSWLAALLRPTYHRLASAGILRRMLPESMRFQLILLDRPAGTEFQLLMGRRVIGRRLPDKTGWHIRRPFRLFVDEASLAKKTCQLSADRCS